MTDLLARLRAALKDRYAVERAIGEGGMALVFLAEDLKHKRAVALKVLRPELAATLGTDRFLREIEMAARLQHPHIVPLYDSGIADGFLYYVMPFIEGESLRDRLKREQSLPLDQAVRVVREAGSALAYAHAQGVIHRDIKPENIMLSGGHAVVADFGIARAVDAATSGRQLTGVGLAIGTPAYMSPEQATADEEVDGRSDQFSLACVFYEMVAGSQAFGGSTIQAVMAKSITGPRPRLRTVDRTIPLDVDEAVVRALDAEPAKRYPTVPEFIGALEAGISGAGDASRRRTRRLRALAVVLPVGVALLAGLWYFLERSHRMPVVRGAETIAVMPFAVTGEGFHDLGEGMVDLLSTNLDAVGGIRTVEPRTVLQQWRRKAQGGSLDLAGALAVARDVKAESVLLGSLVATGPRVRLSADLYSLDGTRLARAQVDGAADSVLTLVDGLSLALLQEIWRSREPLPSVRASAITTTSVDAIRSYLEGERQYRLSRWDSAQVAFERAIRQDSTFALAYYRLASTLGWSGSYQSPASRAASAKAVKYSERLPPRERGVVYAYSLFLEGKVAAVDSMLRYTATYPDDADGWFLLGEAQYHTRDINPLSPAALRAPFDRVLALDSSLTPAAIHPIEVALASRDSVMFRQYQRLFQRAGSSQVEEARLAAPLVWGGTDRDSAAIALFAGRPHGMLFAAITALYRGPAVTGDSLVHIARLAAGALPATPGGAQGGGGVALIYLSVGRVDQARQLMDSLRRIPGAGEAATFGSFSPVFLGYATPEYGRRLMAGMDGAAARQGANPYFALLRTVTALSLGDTVKAAGLIRTALAADTAVYPTPVKHLFRAADGWQTLIRGDTTAGLAKLSTGLREAGAGTGSRLSAPLRWQLAQALAARPATRDEGLRRLRYGFDMDYEYLPMAQYVEGRVHEAAGDRDAAAESYGRFLRLWAGADSAYQGRVEDARRRLEELTGEAVAR